VTPEARSALIERHVALPRRAAAMLHPRVREHVDLDELIAMGNLGLAEAASRFDPDHGASFSTFAWYRVQGAMIDGLRRMSHLPRRVWAQIATLRAAAEYLEAQAQRAEVARAQAAAATTADKLGEVKAALGAIRTMYVVALDQVPDERLASVEVTADVELGRARQAARLRQALERLPERERALVLAHYRDDQTLQDAGAAMGLSKSWASRLHARAIDRLRELLQDDQAVADATGPPGAASEPSRW
jgi:RNA polymerase sigma factor for flagellar operon FliA